MALKVFYKAKETVTGCGKKHAEALPSAVKHMKGYKAPKDKNGKDVDFSKKFINGKFTGKNGDLEFDTKPLEADIGDDFNFRAMIETVYTRANTKKKTAD